MKRQPENRPEPGPLGKPESVLPTNLEILQGAGIKFDFFVDSAEGVSLVLDADLAIRRAEAARKRLLQSPDIGHTALI
jgi:hypothetical protein